MRQVVSLLLILSMFAWPAWAAPDRTMSIAPVAVSGETVSASDENSRNNEISTEFNAHTHNDITVLTTVNTFTIGDGAVGNKTYAVNTDQSADPGLRYNTSNDFWTLSNDGSTYLAAAHASTTDGLQSGQMLYGGTTSGAIVATTATNGQIMIGSSSGTPRIGVISGSGGISIANGDGTITVQHAVDGFATPALTLGTSNTAGTSSTAIRSNATVAAFDSTVPASVGTSNATGSASVASRRDHVHAQSNSGWIYVETVTLSGSSTSTSTLPTSSDWFMLVLEDCSASSDTLRMRYNGDAGGDYNYVTIATATLAATSGATEFTLAATSVTIGGIIMFYRPTEARTLFQLESGTLANTLPFGKGNWTGTVTTVVFSSAVTSISGTVHVYRLSNQ